MQMRLPSHQDLKRLLARLFYTNNIFDESPCPSAIEDVVLRSEDLITSRF